MAAKVIADRSATKDIVIAINTGISSAGDNFREVDDAVEATLGVARISCRATMGERSSLVVVTTIAGEVEVAKHRYLASIRIVIVKGDLLALVLKERSSLVITTIARKVKVAKHCYMASIRIVIVKEDLLALVLKVAIAIVIIIIG